MIQQENKFRKGVWVYIVNKFIDTIKLSSEKVKELQIQLIFNFFHIFMLGRETCYHQDKGKIQSSQTEACHLHIKKQKRT